MKLIDKVAIVTGAIQGIGKGIAISPGPIMTSHQRQAFPTQELEDARNRAVPMNMFKMIRYLSDSK